VCCLIELILEEVEVVKLVERITKGGSMSWVGEGRHCSTPIESAPADHSV
jgi:hypothetical protein